MSRLAPLLAAGFALGFVAPAFLFAAVAASPSDLPKAPDEEGRDYARAYCSSCHAVGLTGSSPNPNAPTFRDVANRYPIEEMRQRIEDGFVEGHPKMPRFVLSPERADDLVAYLKTLRR